jgi:RimJ/RimL family protein N-acetyltransferase
MFPLVVEDFWSTTFTGAAVLSRSETFVLAVNADLSEDRRLMLLTTPDGMTRAVLTPSVREALKLTPDLSESDFRRALADAGLALHGADRLFYFSQTDLEALLHESPHDDDVRQLTDDDAAIFAEFETSAPPQDLDDAYVELDHWAVFGGFAERRLVSAASMYPWGGARLADVGILTLPPFRGRGHARAVVRAICRYAAQQGYQPQYRCQLDNQASAALAKAAGLTPFGTWEVVSAATSES